MDARRRPFGRRDILCDAIVGFIGTLIGAALFNLAARITGGVEIEVA